MKKDRLIVRFVLVLIGSLTLSGCLTVGPDYEEPEVPVPDQWSVELTGDLQKDSPLQKWWEVFDDPVLDELLAKATESNPPLQIALSRIREAGAQRRIASSALFPQVGGSGDYTRQSAADDFAIPGADDPSDNYFLGLDAGWEIDFFGGVRRGVESARAGADAAVEDYRDVLVTLLAEVALQYIQHQTLVERIALAQSNIDTQGQSVQLTQDRFDAGLSPEIDVFQAQSNLATSRSLIPQLKEQKRATLNRLATLLGIFPAEVEPILQKARGIPRAPSTYAMGWPADVMRRRPDVRRAERQLASQTARIGVATADLYPRFTLFGSFGLQALSSGNLFESGASTYGFGPAFRWEIFSAGRIRSQIRVEEERTEQALLGYENTILLAVEEVENAMVSIAQERIRVQRLGEAVDATQKTFSLIRENYKAGLVDFQNVLDTERTLFGAQDDLAASRGRVSQNYVRLYKALGGGWSEAQEP